MYLYTRVALWDEGMDDQVQLFPYLIHYLTWPKPKGYHPEKDLTPPVALATDEVWKQFHLTPGQLESKKLALMAHKSQYILIPTLSIVLHQKQ